jgi:hypothetical protein
MTLNRDVFSIHLLLPAVFGKPVSSFPRHALAASPIAADSAAPFI